MNNLKLVNDNYGHFLGDELLKTFANTLREVCPEYCYIIRMGGDEFLIIIEGKDGGEARDIIERIQLNAGHGQYLHYGINVDESNVQQYFAPITLHRINIQLWAVNNVLYDSNNSDASFEFEITMVKNKKLLV